MPALTGIQLDSPARFNLGSQKVTGDTWACAWADDDQLYTVIDDTVGFDLAYLPSQGRNAMIASFGSSAPANLKGENINGLEMYGRTMQKGQDGAAWKGNGLISVDGVLYLSVSRHWYHLPDYDFRQISRHCSIVKSEDKGRTWTPAPQCAEPLPEPLFPGSRFATCFFVDYGKDGSPQTLPHGADRYIYAVSTDGYWDNGNAIHLGRVPREKIGNLKLEDWEFFCGTRGGASGSPIWRNGKPGLEACYPILSSPFGFGQTGMNYISQLGRYVLIGWHYPNLAKDVWDHVTSVWDFYEAETPWGPWRKFASHTWADGFYNPILPSKFISEDGREACVLTCGNFNTYNEPINQTLYTLHTVKLTLKTD